MQPCHVLAVPLSAARHPAPAAMCPTYSAPHTVPHLQCPTYSAPHTVPESCIQATQAFQFTEEGDEKNCSPQAPQTPSNYWPRPFPWHGQPSRSSLRCAWAAMQRREGCIPHRSPWSAKRVGGWVGLQPSRQQQSTSPGKPPRVQPAPATTHCCTRKLAMQGVVAIAAVVSAWVGLQPCMATDHGHSWPARAAKGRLSSAAFWPAWPARGAVSCHGCSLAAA
jgi:hypothetical protein